NSLKFNSKCPRRAIAELEVAGNPSASMKKDDGGGWYANGSVLAGTDWSRPALDDEISHLGQYRQRVVLLTGGSQHREFISSALGCQFVWLPERQLGQNLGDVRVQAIDHDSLSFTW